MLLLCRYWGVVGVKCLFVASTSFRVSEHTCVRLHQVRARHLFAVCGEFINLQVDASDFVRVGGSVALAGAEAQPEACPVVSLRTLPSHICWCN